jgi:hypothetical protein
MARPVIFDESAALRIVNTIRIVETGDRSERPLTFDPVPVSQQRKTFRIATFTGAWSIGATKTVTFKFQANTPNTVVATNLFFPFPAPTSARDCSIAKDGTAWFLVDVPFETAIAVFSGSFSDRTVVEDVSVQAEFVATTASTAVLQGISINAVLNTSNCAITVNQTNTTGNISYVSGGSVAVTVTKSTASVLVSGSTYTSTFLRFKAN